MKINWKKILAYTILSPILIPIAPFFLILFAFFWAIDEICSR
jgi:hypothetical protein